MFVSCGSVAAATPARLTAPENFGISLTKFEQRFIELDDVSQKISRTRRRRIDKTYARLFAHVQHSAFLRTLKRRDLYAVFRAADEASFYDPSARHIGDMRLDLHELVRRGMETRVELRKFYGALFSARQFRTMRAFYAQWHMQAGLQPPIDVVESPTKTARHRVLQVSKVGRALQGRRVNLRRGVHVVVIAEPGCHFTRDAVSAIGTDVSLNALMGRYSTWISPVNRDMNLDAFRHWNERHPDEAISMAYSNVAWPLIKTWEAPVFLFFRDGKLQTVVTGWSATGVARLQAAFAEVGVAPNRSK